MQEKLKGVPVTPRPRFEYVRADEVAECWDNVSESLSNALWSKVVPHQKRPPNLEDSGPYDHIGHECLSSHWDKLTREEQIELNELADYNEDREI